MNYNVVNRLLIKRNIKKISDDLKNYFLSLTF